MFNTLASRTSAENTCPRLTTEFIGLNLMANTSLTNFVVFLNHRSPFQIRDKIWRFEFHLILRGDFLHQQGAVFCYPFGIQPFCITGYDGTLFRELSHEPAQHGLQDPLMRAGGWPLFLWSILFKGKIYEKGT